MKRAKTLCTSSRRLVWWNVIHSTNISVVLLALKAKGQKILNAPRIRILVHNTFHSFCKMAGYPFYFAILNRRKHHKVCLHRADKMVAWKANAFYAILPSLTKDMIWLTVYKINEVCYKQKKTLGWLRKKYIN